MKWHRGRGTSAARRARAEGGGFDFDVAFTSLPTRAVRTLWITLEEQDPMWLPMYRSWPPDERQYGALKGLNKAQTAERYGDEQVLAWRRWSVTTRGSRARSGAAPRLPRLSFPLPGA